MSGRTSARVGAGESPVAPPSPDDRERLRAELVAAIPRWYRPWAHVLFPSLVGVALAAAALVFFLRPVRLWELVTVPLGFVLLNASEWRIHRDLLHRRTPGFTILYDRHTPMHHRIYVEGDLAMRSDREYRLVLLPSFAIVASSIGTLPIPALLALAGLWNPAVLFFATAVLYVVAYEQLHLAFHRPPESFLGRRKLIAILRRHHATHHRPELMQRWNFNVVVPLWDRVRGTVYRPGAESRGARRSTGETEARE